jgi:hypothetical protein
MTRKRLYKRDSLSGWALNIVYFELPRGFYFLLLCLHPLDYLFINSFHPERALVFVWLASLRITAF